MYMSHFKPHNAANVLIAVTMRGITLYVYLYVLQQDTVTLCAPLTLSSWKDLFDLHWSTWVKQRTHTHLYSVMLACMHWANFHV